MLLALFIVLLIINIVGFMNRQRAWSKIFMVSQVFVVGGLVVMFNVYTGQTGIEGLEAGKKKGIEAPAKLDNLKDMARDQKDRPDTLDAEKEQQQGNQVKFH